MAKKTLTLEEAHAFHAEGDLAQAKGSYLTLLKKHPQNSEILHALGIVSIKLNQLQEAIDYLSLAAKLAPGEPKIHLHLANVLKAESKFVEAETVLKNLLTIHPDYIPALNNLGSVYFAEDKLVEAMSCYQSVIAKEPRFVDAHYNLGLAQVKQGKKQAAIQSFTHLLTLSPTHYAAHFHLACELMKQEQFGEALNHFEKIEAHQPFHFETLTNIATCHLKLGKLSQAKDYYLKALVLAEDDIQVLFNLGIVLTQLGHLDHAIQYYQRALQLNPDFFEAHNNLGVAFLAKQHLGFALKHFQEALRLQPDHGAIRFTIARLSKKQHLLAAPVDYIANLFDGYADHYDAHLLTALEYKVPILLEHAIHDVVTLSQNKLDILDLGCGTGLCGVYFKSYAKTLIGVDLSEKMLAMAQQKNLYTDLILEDMSDFMQKQKEAFDLIIAGDVLVYVGELEACFTLVNQALRPAGYWVFNTEINEDQSFQMNQSGRFSHSKAYLEALASQCHFEILNYKKEVTRLQNNQPVFGHILVLQKKGAVGL